MKGDNQMDMKRIVQTLAVAAVGVGLILVLADSGGKPADKAGAASENVSWAEAVEQEGDHIKPRELADRMLAKKGDTVLVDVRPSEEFVAWHLPGAVNLSVPRVLGAEGEALLAGAGDKLVVLYSNGMVHPGQAWAELARRGHSNVRVLEGGLTDFKREVLTPPSLRGPISEARAKAERPRFLAAKAFFLGPQSGAGAAVTAAGHP